ncbi:Hemin import ATP-binding protein HmuV [Raoultella planticola]|uniref:Hemin import ATP-binding protein HmuV n=1 Tax=Raoultella planticola TaxID=575 RepID=A0A485BRE5_RAOPL|nr:Hemin import ATP-binding protein HmuV [Raoultella planticola]
MDNRDSTWRATSLSLLLGKRRIIDDVSVRLSGGEMTALIGPNGAGKSTLLRLLTGFLSPNDGERHVEGRSLEHWSSEALSRRRGGDVATYAAPCRLAGGNGHRHGTLAMGVKIRTHR